MTNTRAHSRIALAQERGRVIRLDYVRALAHLWAITVCVLRRKLMLTERLWAVLIGFVEQESACRAVSIRHASALNNGGFALLQLRPKRVCHACCRLNKAPPKR